MADDWRQQVNAEELLRHLVLAEISDDYEEPDHVFSDVESRAVTCGVPAAPTSVHQILLELVEQGLAKAYELSAFDPVIELADAPALAQVREYYFWITEQGLKVLRSFRNTDNWPFDDEGDLLPAWSRPSY